MRLCQNADTAFFYAQSPDFLKPGLCYSGIEGTTLKYVYNADRPNMEEVATVLQQQLAEIGVTLDVEGLYSNAFFQRFFAIMFQSGEEDQWDLGKIGRAHV